MKRQAWIGIALLALLGGSGVSAGELPCGQPGPGSQKQVGPAGGWFPYGGGLLGWWNPHCFPCGGAPDDYCRKELPNVCRPAYPPWYFWVSSPACCPQGGCCRPGHEPR